MSKGFWIIIAAIVVIFGGVLLFKGNKADAPADGANGSNHVMGDNAKGVVLVEYGDYQCPFCGKFYPLVKTVIEKYKTDILFQFRNLPLSPKPHQNAMAAARAAEAASLQNKFWEMHDLLFQNQSAWSESSSVQQIFEQYAQQLGLDPAKFKTDFASSQVNDTINADIAEFNKTGEQKSTPIFFLNGKKIEPKSLEDFSKLIDDAIAQQNQQQ